MRRIRNYAGLACPGVEQLLAYLRKSDEGAIVAHARKKQFIFETSLDGKPVVVKQYVYGTLKHRLACFLGHSNADRYSAISNYLVRMGIPVPTAILLAKSGHGFLPDCSVYVMERFDGKMLYSRLAKIEVAPERRRAIAEKVAQLVYKLRNAGVVHRDLSTKNILLSSDDQLRLIDLDYASRYRFRGGRFRCRHERDVKFLLSTFLGAPKFADDVAMFLSRLK